MAGFVESGPLPLVLLQHLLPLGAHQDFVAGVIEVGHLHAVLFISGRPQRRFVDDVANVGAGESDGGRSQALQIHIVRQRDVANVHLEDLQSPLFGGASHRHVAIESAGENVNVNAVSAGTVDTDALKHFPNREEMLRTSLERTPAGRLVTPDDVANAVLFLCSSRAEMIHGQTIIIDGGYTVAV